MEGTWKDLNEWKINKNNNLIISDDNYDGIIEKASVKVVTQDSVNMVYESLSTKGQTFLFNMKYIKINKIVILWVFIRACIKTFKLFVLFMAITYFVSKSLKVAVWC